MRHGTVTVITDGGDAGVRYSGWQHDACSDSVAGTVTAGRGPVIHDD